MTRAFAPVEFHEPRSRPGEALLAGGRSSVEPREDVVRVYWVTLLFPAEADEHPVVQDRFCIELREPPGDEGVPYEMVRGLEWHEMPIEASFIWAFAPKRILPDLHRVGKLVWERGRA